MDYCLRLPIGHNAAMRSHRSSSKADRLPPNSPLGRYWMKTQRPLNMLVFVLPLIAVYEVGVALDGTNLLARHQLKHFLAMLGGSAMYLPAMLVIVVLLAWQISSRHKWKVDAGTLAGMFAESILWALPLLGLALLSQRAQMAAQDAPVLADSLTASRELLIGVGGGVYEEFLFRLVGLNLLSLILVDVLEIPRDWGHATAVAISAVLFSLYHFVGDQAFAAAPFLFYALAGTYLGGVFLMRGFGISVGAHVFYNILVVLQTKL
jgi:membrane protease YdiL (CAAX protease family)